MAVKQITTQDSIPNHSKHAKYQHNNREKIEARRLARRYCKLNGCCEFCGATEKLEFHHFAGYRLWWIFVTACKPCHEWADKKHEDTYKDERRIYLKDARLIAMRLGRYDEFFGAQGKPRDPAMYKHLKPIKVYHPLKKGFEVRYG
jgi:hypothetical protein